MTKLLVTGSSGKMGGEVLGYLLDDLKIAPSNIVAGSRDTGKLSAWAARGVETRKVDFDDPDLADNLGGIDRMLMISTDALDEPGKRLRQHLAAVDAAKAAGVSHVVYTSMPNPDPDSVIPFAPDHAGTEAALAKSGLSHTILRMSWYAENLMMSLPQALQTGQLFTAAGDGKIAYATHADCALAAASALANPPSGNVTYTITGPDAVSNADVATAAKAIWGKDIAVVNVPPEGLEQGMLAAGLPEPVAKLLVAFDLNTAAGKVAEVTGDFTKLTGRAPMGFNDFMTSNAAAFSAQHTAE